ncbi:hypothetical protein OOK27_10820 [Streptomyces canus]|uniref:hypothetical protein n=1 Tax=Streptomyces canus TaxID=58343 RepID=UPI0022510E8F|nr:hypothetical protein [Streptomyces canus]MCX5254671.1 hypothetical protein [Streptomyces canus]
MTAVHSYSPDIVAEDVSYAGARADVRQCRAGLRQVRVDARLAGDLDVRGHILEDGVGGEEIHRGGDVAPPQGVREAGDCAAHQR